MFPWGKYIVPKGRHLSPQETYLELAFSLLLHGEVTS